jgi:hypothetical protein
VVAATAPTIRPAKVRQSFGVKHPLPRSLRIN